MAQSLDRRGRSELNRNTTEMNRAHTAACRGGEEALIMRLAVGYYDDNRWGEASRAPIDGLRLHHSKAGSVAPRARDAEAPAVPCTCSR